MQSDEAKRAVHEKARELAAKLTERLAKSVIAPPPRPLTECMLVLVSTWKADDESVVMGAVERGKQRASAGGDGKMSKMFFGALRFFGFGYIEATGEGGVEVSKQEGSENVWVITTTIGVRVESSESLALTLATLGEKAKSLPNGVLCALTGLKPGKATLVDFQVDMA